MSTEGKNVYDMRRAELVVEARRLGVRNPESYIVRELRGVIQARRQLT